MLILTGQRRGICVELVEVDEAGLADGKVQWCSGRKDDRDEVWC